MLLKYCMPASDWAQTPILNRSDTWTLTIYYELKNNIYITPGHPFKNYK